MFFDTDMNTSILSAVAQVPKIILSAVETVYYILNLLLSQSR